MNHLDVFTRSDGKYDFRIVDTGNHKTLCSSSQGYENRADAVDTGKQVLHGEADPVVTFDGTVEDF